MTFSLKNTLNPFDKSIISINENNYLTKDNSL